MLNPRAKPFQQCNNQPVTLIHRYHAQPTAQVLHHGYYPISPYPNSRPCYYKAPYLVPPSPPVPVVLLPLQSPPPMCVPLPTIINKQPQHPDTYAPFNDITSPTYTVSTEAKGFPKSNFGTKGVAPKKYKELRKLSSFHASSQKEKSTNCEVKQVWRPKGGNYGKVLEKFDHLDFNVVEARVHGKTSVMIKNIPNSFRKKVLLEILDKHCFQENEKIKKQENEHSSNCFSEYDFLYLPMDFRSGYNLGYAFVNFTSGVGAVRFYNAYHMFKWDNTTSGKVCNITHARIQGREKLTKNFDCSWFACHTDEFLPTVFTPPRNGAESTGSTPFLIGRRASAILQGLETVVPVPDDLIVVGVVLVVQEFSVVSLEVVL
ncbi:hypothetical protein IFM89_001842 [Coptis chinensis]|uniref:Mei2-like C-terminal RNA recognition motif domain-containing protein n=1 Tax=Coptis chinensis TaxID=261450 RepID=A0A835HHQ6_9MAGN|nr:hypothetical protein IFM89_001842 [Coptis chinensis]